MSEFETIDLPRPRTSGNDSDESKRSGRGCAFKLFFGFLIFALLTVAGLLVLIYRSSQVSGKMIAFGDRHGNIREKVIVRGDPGQKIIVIRVAGIIYPGDEISRNNTASDVIIDQLRKARDDATVKAIILDMDTPGGAVTATDEIHHELLAVRKHGIKIITCMRTIAASGGYYLAAGTDYIIANRLTLTGSIGVIIGGYNVYDLFNKLGIKSEIYKSGEFKDILNMGRPRTDAEVKLIQNLVDETYQEFAQIIATGRNLDLSAVMDAPVGDGRIYSGQRALELGLVDQLGFLEDAVEKAKQLTRSLNPSIIRYVPQYSLSEFFLSLRSAVSSELLPNPSRLIKPGLPYYLYPLAL